MITQKRLIELVEYSPEWGLFTLRETGKVVYTTDAAGFIRLYLDKAIYPGHRMAWLYYYGEIPKKHIIHKDGDKTNNSIRNLVLSGSPEAVEKKRKMMGLLDDTPMSDEKKYNLRLSKYTAHGYKPVGRHLIRDEGDDFKSIILEYERYIKSLIE